MKLLKNLLVVVAATGVGVMAPAQAQTPGNTFDLGTLSPTVIATTDVFASGSFLDRFNFTVDQTNHIVQGGTSSTNVSNLQLQLLDSGNTLLFTGLNLNQSLAEGNYHVLISGDVIASPGQFTFSVAAANPEPAEWMLLLSGLMIAGFIARRKISLVAG